MPPQKPQSWHPSNGSPSGPLWPIAHTESSYRLKQPPQRQSRGQSTEHNQGYTRSQAWGRPPRLRGRGNMENATCPRSTGGQPQPPDQRTLA